jgi:tetratricopeptide (TPR) repeat protein
MSESLRTADWVNKGAKAKGFKDPLFYNGSQYTKHMKNPEHPLSPSHGACRGRLIQMAVALGMALACSLLPVQAQTDAAPAWQPGQLLNTLQTDAHDEVRKLLRQGRHEAALTSINQALTTNPRDPQMLFWRAYIFERLGQVDAAMTLYVALTEEYPELAEPHNNLGVLYAAKGDYPRAKQAFDMALRDNPSYAIAHENLGDLLLHMARQSYEQALRADAKLRFAQQKIQALQPVLELSLRKP